MSYIITAVVSLFIGATLGFFAFAVLEAADGGEDLQPESPVPEAEQVQPTAAECKTQLENSIKK